MATSIGAVTWTLTNSQQLLNTRPILCDSIIINSLFVLRERERSVNLEYMFVMWSADGWLGWVLTCVYVLHATPHTHTLVAITQSCFVPPFGGIHCLLWPGWRLRPD